MVTVASCVVDGTSRSGGVGWSEIGEGEGCCSSVY